MGQNVFGNVNGFGNPVEERKRKAQAGVQQNAGFGIATTPSSPAGSGGATLPIAAPDNGLAQAITSPAPQYAPSGGGNASGAMPKTSTGFDPSGHPDLHGHAQESWKSHGIDFDGLLKAGIANSASGSALSRDLFQRDHAADLNLKYIQGANAQMQPKSVERNQDIDLLHTLASQMATVMPTMQGPVGRDGKPTMVPNPQYHQLQANYNQLMQKLGLIGTSTGFGGQPTTGAATPQPGAPNPNNPAVQGFGGSLKSFGHGLTEMMGGVGGMAGMGSILGKVPLPGPLGAVAKVVGPALGWVGGSMAADKAYTGAFDNVNDSDAAHPMAKTMGQIAGFAAPMANKVKSMFGFGGKPAGGTPPPTMKPSENFEAPITPEVITPTPVRQTPQLGLGGTQPNFQMNPNGQPPVSYGSGMQGPQPGAAQKMLSAPAIVTQPQAENITGFGNFPHTPKFNPNMPATPKIRKSDKKK